MKEEGRRKKEEGRDTKSELRKAKSEFPEITLEMNPDDVTEEYLAELSQSSVNRISLGVQSFFDEDLAYLERRHDAKQAKKAIDLICDAGYGIRDTDHENRESRIANHVSICMLSIDLIYGIPTLSNDHWKENLKRVIDMGIPHISAYPLELEPKTTLAWQINKSIRHPVSEDLASEQFTILMEIMDQAGYLHYEISTFCLPGYESMHNSNYWRGVPYLGLGPSAHSFNGTSRQWNISNLSSYIQQINSGILPFEEEILTASQRYNEYVMTSLRTMWGCDIAKIREDFGAENEDHFIRQATQHLASGHLVESSGKYTLTAKGKFLADGIAAELFYED